MGNGDEYFFDAERESHIDSLFILSDIWQEEQEYYKENSKKHAKYKGISGRNIKFADGKHSIKLPRKRKKALQSKQRGIRQFKQ